MKQNLDIQEVILDLKSISNYLQAKLNKINAVIQSLDSLIEDNEDFISHLISNDSTKKRTI